MIVRIKWSALQQTHGYEYLVRFALGGLATLLAGVIADRFGPETGGLFLAFPPSSARAPRWSRSMSAIEKPARA